jgi:hypothetical protein
MVDREPFFKAFRAFSKGESRLSEAQTAAWLDPEAESSPPAPEITFSEMS